MAQLWPQAGGAGEGASGVCRALGCCGPRRVQELVRQRRPDFKTAPVTSARRDVTRHFDVMDTAHSADPGNCLGAKTAGIGPDAQEGGMDGLSSQSPAALRPEAVLCVVGFRRVRFPDSQLLLRIPVRTLLC